VRPEWRGEGRQLVGKTKDFEKNTEGTGDYLLLKTINDGSSLEPLLIKLINSSSKLEMLLILLAFISSSSSWKPLL
jgi:hypothetical protein